MTGSPGILLAPDLAPGPRAALVIATASYRDPALSQLRATADDAQALTDVLGDPGIGGFTVTPVIDADERQMRRMIDLFLSDRSTRDVVLIYMSCHGVLDRRNRLYFAAADTVKDQLSSTGISAAWLLEQLEECRARQQVVILDCCFSGAFEKGSKGEGELDLERRLFGSGRGRAVLTASRSGEYSFTGDALLGAAVSGSVFTAGLVEGLRTGDADAGGDGYISVDEAYDFAYRYVLSLDAAQTPQRWLSGGEGAIVLARSPAGIAIRPAMLPQELADALESRYPTIRIGAVQELGSWLAGDDPGRALTAEQKLRHIAENDNHAVATAARAYLTTPGRATAKASPHSSSTAKDEHTAAAPTAKVLEPAHSIRDRKARLLADAERVALSITDESYKASALSEVVKAVAPTDPDGAERIAQSITNETYKSSALSAVARAVAPINPDRAERIARSVTDESYKASALSAVAKAIAATNPDHAARLLADAERAARSITDKSSKASALSAVAKAIAATNPDHAARLLADAERAARSITDKSSKASALSAVAKAIAATNPDHAARLLADAERAARSITNGISMAWALSEIVRVVAPTNPDGAERIAQSITDKNSKASALSAVARAVAPINPDRAERIAQSITNESYKASALSAVAKAIATTNPDHAARLLADAERAARAVANESSKASALNEVAKAVAATNPDRAERVAQSITDESYKASALSAVVKAIATTNPDHAARLLADAERAARAITDESYKASALNEVAKAVAATNPDRAERVAQSITDKSSKASALSEVAKAVAATNPDHAARLLADAERAARSITNENHQASALRQVAIATVTGWSTL